MRLKGKVPMRRIPLFLLFLALSPLFAEGQTEPAVRENPAPVRTFRDGKGSEVAVPGEIKRIIVLNSGLSSLLAALDQTHRIVGRDSFSTFPSSLRSAMVVGKSSAYPNLELILAQKPDLVLADAMFDESISEKLKALGIPVLIEATSDPQGTRDLLTRYGDLLGCSDRADQIIQELDLADARLARLISRAQAGGEDAPKVFFESRKNYKSTSAKSPTHQYLALSGGINIAAEEGVSSPTLSPEFIVTGDPDVIIRRVSGDLTEATMASMRENILNRPGLSTTSAVRDRRVHIIKADLFLTVRYPAALYYHASWFYPETFRDADPDDFNREWTDFLFGEGAFESTKESYTYSGE